MRTNKVGIRILNSACGVLALLAADTASAWEFGYGPLNTLEEGRRRVTPVNACPGGGYIAVGTQGLGTANPDVYLVRTGVGGGPIWEFSYDVQGMAFPDEGVALAQVPNNGGFVILSNTMVAAGIWAPALTQVNCNGAVVWSQIYPDIGGRNLRGHDLIRTNNPAGQLAVAGLSAGVADNDAFLMRTNPVGALIWSTSYDNSAPEHFNALTEAAPVAGQLVADLVAVGQINLLNNVQGLIARVNGATGAIGAAPQCMAHHGGGAADVYNSVIRLVAGAGFAGQFAMTGITRNNPWLEDVWVVRSNNCAIAAQSRIGTAASFEGGHDLREVLVPLPAVVPAVQVGDLAITGYQRPGGVAVTNAPLLMVAVGPLTPILANLFGGAGNEIGYSLAQNPGGFPAGFVISGLTTTNWGPADPQDLYLVNTVNAGGVATLCSVPWNPGVFMPAWPSNPLAPVLLMPAQGFVVQTPAMPWVTPFQICP